MAMSLRDGDGPQDIGGGVWLASSSSSCLDDGGSGGMAREVPEKSRHLGNKRKDGCVNVACGVPGAIQVETPS